ncbi:MAG: thioredoxin domain-containing protein [Gammaproteobacteria bacterium]
MYQRIMYNLLLGLLLCASPAILPAFETATSAEFEALRQDLEALKQGQETLGKDVAEIKKLLQALQPPPPVRAIDAVLEAGDSPSKGEKDATLILIEFSDYECPFCRRHAETTLPQLEKDYIATGKLRYLFRDFPLETIHAQAAKAAEAAHCAGEQGRYWEMHDNLFANQKALAPEKLTAYAKAIGVTAGPFKKCLGSGKYMDKVRNSVAEGHRLGITGTPALLLGINEGGKVKNAKIIAGALPFSVFKEEIDKLLAEQSAKK